MIARPSTAADEGSPEEESIGAAGAGAAAMTSTAAVADQTKLVATHDEVSNVGGLLFGRIFLFVITCVPPDTTFMLRRT
jgi:hypothetical protein